MIQPLQFKSNISFRATMEQTAPSFHIKNANPTGETGKKTNFKNKAQNMYKKGSEIINKISNIFSPILTPVKAPVQGASALVGVGIIGKNVKNSEGSIIKAIKGSVSDIGKGALGLVKSIPNIVTKSPIENIKNILSAPLKFYSKYLKSHKGLTIGATLLGAGIMGRKHIISGIKTLKEKSRTDLENKPENKEIATK